MNPFKKIAERRFKTLRQIVQCVTTDYVLKKQNFFPDFNPVAGKTLGVQPVQHWLPIFHNMFYNMYKTLDTSSLQTSGLRTSGLQSSGHRTSGLQTSDHLAFWPSGHPDFWTFGLLAFFPDYDCLDLPCPCRLHQFQIPNVLPAVYVYYSFRH